ncbi:MAG TPA: bifunctional phosphopantothenoylcysteine decarboxylase/phosphopantothenate--cysteine ligase CoaBC [Deltaproteobacteria bacterium]|nr:bifunctional phosphopantothenoylcysteine decarboxylase/phosphopantothenate--cysteine ligase CoaBC [Deltaproteobacteria bacterium]
MLSEKRILLGVTGGIAAYKAAELIRSFVKAGARVRVVMTESACRFITPMTLGTLSGGEVYTDTFETTRDGEIPHIDLAYWADLVVVAPATANILGKIAGGMGDDLLSTTMLAVTAPVLLCPAMNSNMYANPAVQANIKKLADRGCRILDADSGDLACRTTGPGRLPSPEDILEVVETMFAKKDLAGVRVLVTAGPTQEPLDPVRFITNHSSGKMGFALAQAARRRGADVTLVSGPVSLDAPPGVELVPVQDARSMRDAVMNRLAGSDVIIKAAAVSDYRPSETSLSKIKKSDETLTVTLERNPDILASVGEEKGNRILVGFAMETEDLVENAQRKLSSKNLDLIVANDLGEPGAGFRHDTNVVRILDREGGDETLPLMEKKEVAERIIDRIVALLEKRA